MVAVLGHGGAFLPDPDVGAIFAFAGGSKDKFTFPLLAVILSVNLIVVIYSGATRYGIPMVVSFMPFAALALDRLGDPPPRAVSRRATVI